MDRLPVAVQLPYGVWFIGRLERWKRRTGRDNAFRLIGPGWHDDA